MGKQDAASPASTEDNPDVLEKRMCKNMYAAALGSGLPTALPVAGFPEFPSFYMSSFLVYSCPLCYDAIASMASPPLSWWCGLYYQPCRLSGTSSSLEPYEHRL